MYYRFHNMGLSKLFTSMHTPIHTQMYLYILFITTYYIHKYIYITSNIWNIFKASFNKSQRGLLIFTCLSNLIMFDLNVLIRVSHLLCYIFVCGTYESRQVVEDRSVFLLTRWYKWWSYWWQCLTKWCGTLVEFYKIKYLQWGKMDAFWKNKISIC